MSARDGGPAFPHCAEFVQSTPTGIVTTPITSNGMTLRDYFAAKAMQAFATGMIFPPNSEDNGSMQRWAANAYAMANAMLAARDAKP